MGNSSNMTKRRLLWSNLWHYRRSHSFVMLGVLVGTAVLTGALLIGDSLRGSLQALAIHRLGKIDYVLAPPHFFTADLAARLSSLAEGNLAHAAPAILLPGTVIVRDDQGRIRRRAGKVHVVGVDERFWQLFDERPLDLGNEVLINQTLADELKVDRRDLLEIRIDKPHVVPADSIIGRRREFEGILLESSPIQSILPNTGSGGFSLILESAQPRLIYVQLRRLQNRLARDADQPPGAANLLLAETQGRMIQDRLQADLGRAVTPEDYGLRIVHDSQLSPMVSVESRRMILEPECVQALLPLKSSHAIEMVPTLTYLSNLMLRQDHFEAELAMALAGMAVPLPSSASRLALAAVSYTPYSAVTGLDPTDPPPFGPLLGLQGQSMASLKEDEILLTEFVARDLWPMGDWEKGIGRSKIRMSYFIEGDGYRLIESSHTFTLAGVVPNGGPVANATLTPDFPGMRGARIKDWKPPFPPEHWHPAWIRDADEQFYHQWQVAPKAFVSPATAKKLWKSRYGEYTSVRMAPRDGNVEKLLASLHIQLASLLPPESMGMSFQPVKALALASTHKGTAAIFGWLFFGFSLFIILAALILIGLLFRFGVEQRASEIGLMLALGFSLRQIRVGFWLEGLFISFLGSTLGLLFAIGYAQGLIAGMRWGWHGSIETSFLQFHLAQHDPATGWLPYPSLVIGFGLSMSFSLTVLALALRGQAHLSPRQLLGGTTQVALQVASSRWFNLVVVLVCFLLAFALAIASTLVQDAKWVSGFFFGSGCLWLGAGIGAWRWHLRREATATFDVRSRWALWQLAGSNLSRMPTRSLLTVGMLAAGIFMVLAVQAFRKDTPHNLSPEGGTGGFDWIAESDVALPYIPENKTILERLLADADLEQLLPATLPIQTIAGFRLRSGDDVSCLNLFQPRKPRVLGVPSSFIKLKRFTLSLGSDASDHERSEPWKILERTMTDHEGQPIVPLVADNHTAQWILQKGIGDRWWIANDADQLIQVQLVGMVEDSIFQSELLIAETHFARLFPNLPGYRFFLIESLSQQSDRVKDGFDQSLGEPFGWHMSSTFERLQAFQAVENTYLSTFQLLGSLGLLLGSVGLAVVMLRNFNERRAEWALLRALGFAKRQLGRLALLENVWLIGMGILIGGSSALLAIVPRWILIGSPFPWRLLLLVTLGIAGVGLLSGWMAIRFAMQTPILEVLRRDHE